MDPAPHRTGAHRPRMAGEDAERIRAWHDGAYAGLLGETPARITYLGRVFTVPPTVFPVARVSALLGRAVLAEVRATDRVLDMGTGCGVNAVLAATAERPAREVLGVDVNENAIQAATVNAALNGATERTSFRLSDVFGAVDGRFDLMVFDPPFRWFPARDLTEAAMTDENYRALTAFMTGARRHLAADGRILMFFGTSGDVEYLRELADAEGLDRETVAETRLLKDGVEVRYVTLRLRPAGRGARR